MWPIRKRDDGDKERSGQVVMNGEERRKRWREEEGGGRTFQLQLLAALFTQVAFLALRVHAETNISFCSIFLKRLEKHPRASL